MYKMQKKFAYNLDSAAYFPGMKQLASFLNKEEGK